MSVEFQPSFYTKSREKRAIDIAMAAILLPFAIPAMGVIGLAIKMEGAGSIIFTQERVGKDGKLFKIHKLRTIGYNGERTRIGKTVRPLGLDELPQLFSIIKGEMSAFGIRAMSVEDFEYTCNLHLTEPEIFSEELITRWKEAYLSSRPGGVSLAASQAPSVLNRGYANSAGLKQKLEYDISHVENESFQMDLEILDNIIHRAFEQPQNIAFMK